MENENVVTVAAVAALANLIQKLERVASAHEIELQEIRKALKVVERERLNRERFLQRQIVVTREHVDVLEQRVANARSERRLQRS